MIVDDTPTDEHIERQPLVDILVALMLINDIFLYLHGDL